MSLLFLIQSHKDSDQLARLVRILRKGCRDSVVLISHDFRVTSLPSTRFGGDSNVHVIDGRGGRGDFHIVDAYLSAVRWIKKNKVEYEWITNLSGQDYPVSSLASFSNQLSQTDHDGYLHHFDVLRQEPQEVLPMVWPKSHGYSRYYYQFTKIKDHLNVVERAALRIPRQALERSTDRFRINTAYGLLIGRRAEQTPFTPHFRCYAGSYWHTIRRACAEYLLEFAETHPDIVRYFKKVLIPDECFAQTVLVNWPGFRFVNDNRRYFDMRGSRHGHPKILNENDAEKFVDQRYFFARKFEEGNQSALLDRLDRYALQDISDRAGVTETLRRQARSSGTSELAHVGKDAS